MSVFTIIITAIVFIILFVGFAIFGTVDDPEQLKHTKIKPYTIALRVLYISIVIISVGYGFFLGTICN